MSEGDALEVTRLAGEQDVRSVVRFLSARARSPKLLAIDFGEVGSGRAERVDSLWVEALSNALVGEFGHLRLSVRLPEAESGLKAFARAGMLFALAQRPHELTEVAEPQRGPEWASRSTWAGSWSPSDSGFSAQLFGEPGPHVDELIQSEFVTFLNPHLAAQDEELTEQLTDTQVMPWATRLVGRIGKGLTEEDRDRLGEAIDDITTELILNLGHAFRRHPGPRGFVPTPRQKCYVQVYTTEGGGAASHNRLHLVVADVGHGIVSTLRPKLAEVDSDYKSLDGSELVRRLLKNELPGFGRASGLGYQRIVEAVLNLGGAMRLTTGSFDDADHVLEALVGNVESDEIVVRASTALHFVGTTAHATIPLQPRPRDSTR